MEAVVRVSRRRPYVPPVPLAYVMAEMTTLEMARLAYQRACDRYHHAITYESSPFLINQARAEYRHAKAILAAAEAWSASA